MSRIGYTLNRHPAPPSVRPGSRRNIPETPGRHPFREPTRHLTNHPVIGSVDRLAKRFGMERYPLQALANGTFSRLDSPHLRDALYGLEDYLDTGPSLTAPQQRDAISAMILAGMTMDQITLILPHSDQLYEERSRLEYYTQHSWDSGITHFGYPWHKKQPLTASMNAFRKAMAISPGHVVLDPMAGFGVETLHAAKTHPGARFIANDLNPHSLRSLALAAREAGLPESDFRISLRDIQQGLPHLASDSVDRVMVTGYSTFGFDNTALRNFYGEMLRLLKDGGILWADNMLDGNSRLPVSISEVDVPLAMEAAESRGLRLSYASVLGPGLNAVALHVIKPRPTRRAP